MARRISTSNNAFTLARLIQVRDALQIRDAKPEPVRHHVITWQALIDDHIRCQALDGTGLNRICDTFTTKCLLAF
jgi:hypothetical protein